MIKTSDLKRWERAVKKIGTQRMLNLPEQIKEVLKNTRDLKTKADILEKIADSL